MLTFIKKIVSGQKKIYITIATVLTILSCLEFTLISIYSSNLEDITIKMLIAIICTITLFVSCYITMSINNYFVDSKTEEFSIILLSGRNLKQILKYIIIQFGSLFAGTAVFGFILGMGLMQVLNIILSEVGQLPFFNFNLSTSIFVFVSYVMIKVVFIFLLNFGKFIRIKTDIASYMNHTAKESSKPNYFSAFTSNKSDKKKKRFPFGRILSTCIAIYIIIACFIGIMEATVVNTIALYFAFSLCGEIFLLNSTLPLLYDVLHDHYLLKHPTLLLGLTQLMDLSKVLIATININGMVIPIMFIILFMEFSTPLVETVILICFFILMLVILLDFIVQFALYLPTKARDIATLKALGYPKKQILRAQAIEILIFLVFVIGLPIITYSAILYQGYFLQYISIDTVYLLLGGYLIIYTLLCGYMIINYSRLTKEVLLDVKYLNRSE